MLLMTVVRHIRIFLSRKGAELATFYILLFVTLSIAAVLVVRTSRDGISNYNRITESSIRISRIVLDIRDEADKIQASVVRIVFNPERGDIHNEFKMIGSLQREHENNWKQCREWMKNAGLIALYDSLISSRDEYNSISAQLLSTSRLNDKSISFYYTHQMGAYNSYQKSIQNISNHISKHVEEKMKDTNASVRFGYDSVNVLLLVSFFVMIEGSVLIIKHHRKLLNLQKQLTHERTNKVVEISRQALQAQEKERNEIGKELHDNVNQLLTVAKLNLSMVLEKPEKNPELVAKSLSHLQDAIQEIRCLCKSLVSPLVNNISMQESLRELVFIVQQANEKTKFLLSFESIQEQNIDPQLKIALYRIVQEQLNNIIKHANATEVNICIYNGADLLAVYICDNGRGFDITKTRNGIGINNIFNRVEAFQGNATFETAPGKGCAVTITFPFVPVFHKSKSIAVDARKEYIG
jgi:signal transduction histidine kinase